MYATANCAEWHFALFNYHAKAKNTQKLLGAPLSFGLNLTNRMIVLQTNGKNRCFKNEHSNFVFTIEFGD